jgi:hypothetical protein
MCAPKLVDLQDGLQVFASSEIEVLLGIESAHWPLIQRVIMEVQDHDNRLAAVRELLSEHGLKPSVERALLLDDDQLAYLVRAVRD